MKLKFKANVDQIKTVETALELFQFISNLPKDLLQNLPIHLEGYEGPVDVEAWELLEGGSIQRGFRLSPSELVSRGSVELNPDEAIMVFVDQWKQDMLAITDGVKPSWPSEVERAGEILEEELKAKINEVEMKLHDGGFAY